MGEIQVRLGYENSPGELRLKMHVIVPEPQIQQRETTEIILNFEGREIRRTLKARRLGFLNSKKSSNGEALPVSDAKIKCSSNYSSTEGLQNCTMWVNDSMAAAQNNCKGCHCLQIKFGVRSFDRNFYALPEKY
jgi:hypothetical protein